MSNKSLLGYLDKFFKHHMASVGHKSSHTNHLGVTGLRKGFANHVSNASINVDQGTLLNALMSNATRMSLSKHANTAAQRYMHGTKMFNTGVKADSVQFFAEQRNSHALSTIQKCVTKMCSQNVWLYLVILSSSWRNNVRNHSKWKKILSLDAMQSANVCQC